jgi:thiaminase (transcriptional activator TenA)
MRHPFLQALALGTLPIEGFRRYLIQDYLYLIQYARGYALGAYKSETLEEIRAASKIMATILDVEMPLHIAYCAEWGLTEEAMSAAAEDIRMLAYSRFFLECGLAGDKLDLDVAFSQAIPTRLGSRPMRGPNIARRSAARWRRWRRWGNAGAPRRVTPRSSRRFGRQRCWRLRSGESAGRNNG